MNKKLIITVLCLLSINITSFVTANINIDSKIEVSDDIEVEYICIGEYSFSGKQSYQNNIYNKYIWEVGNKVYYFYTEVVTDSDILKGKLSVENYDLLYIPYNEAVAKNINLFFPSLKNFIWKNKVEKYIKDGGGLVGYCAPLNLVTKAKDKPDTLLESLYYRNALDISQVNLISSNCGIPFLSQLTGKPEKIGLSAYYFYAGWYIPLDIRINRDNPIFNDYLDDTRKIAWCAGPAIGLPENEDHNVTPIAYYPEVEISDNKSTQLHAWRYIGGMKGFLNGRIEAKKQDLKSIHHIPGFMVCAEDWEKTDVIIETDMANEPFMTMETYPNEKEGRIILCGGHPEAIVIFGGNIVEANDTDSNSLANYLYNWENYSNYDFSYNWWIVRRNMAWASKKVPDNDLPPVYGPSQVSDIYPYNQTAATFTIYGNAEWDIADVTLDLFYRYSNDNETWNSWMYYDTDYDKFDGWSWEFNVPVTPAYYQFYSLRRVKHEYEWVNETAPPGPDAICYISN